ncbi:MAG: acetate--CoA ligase family protein [Alphaproteobacteria bacterium]|nr:acetate--CoA ligase family protein [Alphaproteobacteria bacterium]
MSQNSLETMFRPKSVAILGASTNENKIGGRPVRYLKHYEFDGPIYPINPNYPEVQGLKAYKSILDVAGGVDLALIALPTAAVLQAIRECAEKGVKAVVIFSSGFAETGDEGREAQLEMRRIADQAGMRIVGPNCMGIAAFDHNMMITFGVSMMNLPPVLGPVSIVSQSGAFGSVAYAEARGRHLGVRLWATTGNESDVSVADCLNYYVEDAETKVILMYFEASRDGAKLMAGLAAAKKARKPVVAMKVGSSDVGAEAALSHTNSLAGSDSVVDTVLAKYNAYRAYTMDEFFDIGYAFTSGLFPAGNRVGIVTISGGVGILMSDYAVKLGLDVARMPETAQAKIKEIIPFAGTRNPVDVTGQAVNQQEILEHCLNIMIEEGAYDVIVVYFAGMTSMEFLLKTGLTRVREKHPTASIILSITMDEEAWKVFDDLNFLVIPDPTRAVRAAAALMRMGQGYAKAERPAPPPLSAPVAPAEMPNEVEAKRLLAKAGVPAVDERLATAADEAGISATEIGFPVAMKLVSTDILHKSEIGGVLLNVADEAAARDGYDILIERAKMAQPDAKVDGVVVAPMISGGVETILGVKVDPTFGPVVLFGLGGIFVELLGDVTQRLAPFGVEEAHEMMREVKGFPLLDGARGAAPADVDALAEALSRLSVFAHENADRIQSIDINPFLVLPKGRGAFAVDALIVPSR